jgi:hypothetical protein
MPGCRSRALVDSLPAMSNSVELIREDRDRGHGAATAAKLPGVSDMA